MKDTTRFQINIFLKFGSQYWNKQAGAELGQAQHKMESGFTSIK